MVFLAFVVTRSKTMQTKETIRQARNYGFLQNSGARFRLRTSARIMFLSAGFALLAAGALCAADDPKTAILKWTVNGEEQPAPLSNGIFRVEKARTRLSIDTPLAENSRMNIFARFSKNGWLIFYTGRRQEQLSCSAVFGETPQIIAQYISPTDESLRKTMLLSGKATPNFSWNDTMLDWQSHYETIAAAVPLEQRWIQLAIELRGEHCRFLVNGRLIHEWTPTEDIYGSKPSLLIDTGCEVRPPAILGLKPADPLHFPVDISATYNAKGLCGEEIAAEALPHGVEFEVGGTPFIVGESALNGMNNLDVGQSWFREGNFTSYETPHNGSFGGRWTGYQSGNPTRFQFPVPFGSITALHLLAASEERPDSTPHVTAQFYRPSAGFPKNFASPEVPLATASSTVASNCLPVKCASGKTLHLWNITIPVEQGLLQEFEDLKIIEFELTKAVQVYRAYPDPCHYSAHAAGLPSSVRVFAVTMETAPVTIKFDPEALGNVWVSAAPSYVARVRNETKRPALVELRLESISHDGVETNRIERKLQIPINNEKQMRFDLPLQRFGHHEVVLTAVCNGATQTFHRALSRLRSREYAARPFDAKGFMFGYWNWRGGHHTPQEPEELRLMGMLGMESTGPGEGSIRTNPETGALARRYGIRSFWAGTRSATAQKYQEDPKKSIADLEQSWREYGRPSTNPLHEPVYINIFAEPGGIGTHGVLPEFYGEPPHKMNESEQTTYKRYHAAALASIKVAKDWNPNIKTLFPWGDPCFAIPFLQANDKLTQLMDGVGVDVGFFDRMPEMQMHQCALHRIYQFLFYWNKFKKTPPVWPCVEGPCIAQVAPGALTEQQHADHFVRSALVLAAYGINRQFSMGAVADCAGWWGEQHYGGGIMSRLSGLNPHLAYSALGALIRNLRHMEFIGWVPTGSLSVYALHFRDSRNSQNLYVLWTLRGKRPITLAMPKGTALELFDSMDNSQRIIAKDTGIELMLTTSPQYLYGAGETLAMTLGEPDHGDALSGAYSKTLGNMADLFPTQGNDADPEYLDSFPDAIRRFHANMVVERANAPEQQGGAALSITLPLQEKDRGVMPFYTALKPEKPVLIPGKASHLTMWVRAASDWGRVVYVLRDAKGEKWTSVGSMGEWNSDDTLCASFFNFDGWRLVRFELPSHAPYDSFREAGTTWWGSSGGDSIVDLPLTIEKIFIERRVRAMYVNSLEPTDPAAVLLGAISAEYDSADEMTEAAVARNRTRMPPPPAGAPRINPITALVEAGTLPASAITAVEQPEHYYDGTRGIFRFKEMEEAVHYDIWLSMHADGSGALKLGNKLKQSGALVNGFRADVEFYAFLVYTDKKGATSKPSAPFKFSLKNQFGMK